MNFESGKRKYHQVRGFHSNDLGIDPDLVVNGSNDKRRERDLKIAIKNREKMHKGEINKDDSEMGKTE